MTEKTKFKIFITFCVLLALITFFIILLMNPDTTRDEVIKRMEQKAKATWVE